MSTGKELQKQHSPREVQNIIFYRIRVLIILYFFKKYIVFSSMPCRHLLAVVNNVQ